MDVPRQTLPQVPRIMEYVLHVVPSAPFSLYIVEGTLYKIARFVFHTPQVLIPPQPQQSTTHSTPNSILNLALIILHITHLLPIFKMKAQQILAVLAACAISGVVTAPTASPDTNLEKKAVAEVWANWNWVGADKKKREAEADALVKKAVAEVWANW